MLGWVTVGEGKKVMSEHTEMLGLAVRKLELPVPGWRWERRVDKALHALVTQGITRVLTPSEFPYWPMLWNKGFRPIDTYSLRCMLAPHWVEEVLRIRGFKKQTAVVCLAGERVSYDLMLVAKNLCPIVRGLVIDAPGGDAFAVELRRAFGLPVLPERWVSDLTLYFKNGPLLVGTEYGLNKGVLPLDCDVLPLLCALWQYACVSLESITLNIKPNCFEMACFP